MHDDIEVVSPRGGGPRAEGAGSAEQCLPGFEARLRLRPSGDHLLAVEGTDERHGAVIIDLRTGERWPVPRDIYPWIAWSYGDTAVVDHTEDDLLACDASRRACEALDPQGEILRPTN